MEKSTIKPGKVMLLPVFPQTLHRVRARIDKTAPSPKSPQRDNIFQNPVTNVKIAASAR
jgi:hypothetical protein